MGKIGVGNRAEERFVQAVFELAKLVTDDDPIVQDLTWQVAHYPMDEVAYTRYFDRKAKLIEQFTSIIFKEIIEDGTPVS